MPRVTSASAIFQKRHLSTHARTDRRCGSQHRGAEQVLTAGEHEHLLRVGRHDQVDRVGLRRSRRSHRRNDDGRRRSNDGVPRGEPSPAARGSESTATTCSPRSTSVRTRAIPAGPPAPVTKTFVTSAPAFFDANHVTPALLLLPTPTTGIGANRPEPEALGGRPTTHSEKIAGIVLKEGALDPPIPASEGGTETHDGRPGRPARRDPPRGAQRRLEHRAAR